MTFPPWRRKNRRGGRVKPALRIYARSGLIQERTAAGGYGLDAATCRDGYTFDLAGMSGSVRLHSVCALRVVTVVERNESGHRGKKRTQSRVDRCATQEHSQPEPNRQEIEMQYLAVQSALPIGEAVQPDSPLLLGRAVLGRSLRRES